MTADIWIRDYNPPRCFQKKISGRGKHNNWSSQQVEVTPTSYSGICRNYNACYALDGLFGTRFCLNVLGGCFVLEIGVKKGDFAFFALFE
jgi:hypothetical protein